MKNAHAALKTAIASKGVDVPDGTKLTDMPALVEQISTEPVPTNPRAVFSYDNNRSIVIPKTMVVDVISMTNLKYCFYTCNALKSLTLPDGFGQNATTCNACFYNCNALTSLRLPDGFGQNATDLLACFRYCSALTTLTLPDGFGQNALDCTVCFAACKSLTTITGSPKFKVSLKLSDSTKLTHDSLMVIINGLQTVTTT